MISESIKLCIKGFIFGIFIGVCAFAFYCGYLVTRPSNYFPEKDSYIILNHPESPVAVARVFSSNGITSEIDNNVNLLKITIKVAELYGYKLKFGEYSLPANISLWDAIKVLSRSETVLHKITIPEGFSVYRVLERINNNQFLLGEIERVPEEGSLMPDTYCFRYPTKKQDIIDWAQRSMTEFIEKEWPKRSEDCFLKTPQEVLTLASIVVKESSIDLETIAGMYLNRLKIGMKLQACPTAIYAQVKGKRFPRSLTYKDLKYDDPYNTYVYEGLPPGPIANPCRKSILAVLHPKKSEWLFLFFDGKLMSKPLYAKTYLEHRKNIAQIRKIHLSKVK